MLMSIIIPLALATGIAILAFKIGFEFGEASGSAPFLKKELADYDEVTDGLRRWMSSEELEKDIQEKN